MPSACMAGDIRFRSGCSYSDRRNLEVEHSWDDAPLRCLHLCFLRRSSADARNPAARENIMELYRGGLPGRLRRLARLILFQKSPSRWKQER
ncbi:MAG: hypothetical protein IAE94_09830 [Chthoniobacterales bacterium]|nr:hypothetical protein [Chthoniobacterales bacterium]